ncbi:unnamed protein product [Phytophthora fragariaefolia]|uniref:Unnamed protein product n=1 Tax=Phytophthora fragariaefolia TaxID=1490495 RepID=A0A9W6WJS0_9STRA|nr:unnamed protein product [Phytophthora fragariaefolia]
MCPGRLSERRGIHLSGSLSRPDTFTYSRAPPPNIWAGSDSDFVPSPVLPGDDTTTTEVRVSKRRKTAAVSIAIKSKRKKAPSTQIRQPSPGLVLSTPTSPPASTVSELGVSLSVQHSRKAVATDDVWDLVHSLDQPYTKRNPWKSSPAQYRNICILCCQDIRARTRPNRYSLEEALRNTKHASNAKDHIKSKHADHPTAVLAEMKTTQKAMDGVISAEADVQDVLYLTGGDYASDATAAAIATGTTTASAVAVSTAPTKPPKRFFNANQKTLNVLISKWLISKGLPYTACACESFEDIMRAATGNPSRVASFRVPESVRSEVSKSDARSLDKWGDDSIIGASIAFIDSLWRFRFIAFMASVKNDGQKNPLVANVIEKSFKLKYDVDSKVMTRFTMSDTTPSAKNVADLIDTKQENGSVHLLNLCIGYGIRLKDNIQTVSVWNGSTESWNKVVTKVTAGGSFDEVGDVIQKLRNLSNYFKTPKQRNALRKIQEALSYPELDPLTENDVRFAYTCKMIRRSVVNFAAFEAYFQSTKDSTSAWSALTAKDWMLAVEIEAVTNFISSLALVETQSENLVSSYMVVFRRLAETKVKSFRFDAMAMEAPRSKDANESSHRRVLRTQQQFSAGKTCLRRALFQLQARYPAVTKESMICILLVPRTKSSAKKIVAVGNIPRKEEKVIYKGGLDYLRDEHRKESTLSPCSSPSSIGWEDEDELLLGAPIRTTKTRDEVKESEINARADRVMQEWLDLEPEWLEIAQRQNPDKMKEEWSKEMTIDKADGMHWGVLGYTST